MGTFLRHEGPVHFHPAAIDEEIKLRSGVLGVPVRVDGLPCHNCANLTLEGPALLNELGVILGTNDGIQIEVAPFVCRTGGE